MIQSGHELNYLTAFLGGVGASLTPCVYPLIPVTAAYISAGAAGSRIKGFLLSLTYVTGIAVTYSILGLLASLTGTLFGKISASPITYFLVGIIIIFFGLAMFDFFKLPLPGIIKSPTPRKHTYLSAFILGLTSGLVASPCLTPILGTILLYLATKKNLFYGATLLFSFAYGMGLILILVGTFSSLLANLPKSGRWLSYIKKLGAIILIITGIYFIFSGIQRLE